MMNFQDDDGLCVLELFFYSSFFFLFGQQKKRSRYLRNVELNTGGSLFYKKNKKTIFKMGHEVKLLLLRKNTNV